MGLLLGRSRRGVPRVAGDPAASSQRTPSWRSRDRRLRVTEARPALMKRVLVLEDDRSIREMVVAVLAEAGYAVAAAVNGAQGLARCREFVPDLIVLDLM